MRFSEGVLAGPLGSQPLGVFGFGSGKEGDIVLDRLTLGTEPNEVVEHNIPGAAVKQPPSILGNRLGLRIGGLISHQFFRNYALTLDFRAMRLLLEDKRKD